MYLPFFQSHPQLLISKSHFLFIQRTHYIINSHQITNKTQKHQEGKAGTFYTIPESGETMEKGNSQKPRGKQTCRKSRQCAIGKQKTEQRSKQLKSKSRVCDQNKELVGRIIRIQERKRKQANDRNQLFFMLKKKENNKFNHEKVNNDTKVKQKDAKYTSICV